MHVDFDWARKGTVQEKEEVEGEKEKTSKQGHYKKIARSTRCNSETVSAAMGGGAEAVGV
ncbi:hypothetical protein C2845_PM16G05480 [Panicum miliaceum]|uniref:Uncharacterized protein n=1 Tax=Panicum miliaceum TaxID=4540 RepID=A0A3L6PZ16_PANMI|nr:hypothetical protein C2845_PM16G05480 [Panicum miliaceum]